ncbi:MAG: Hsp20/alpha crystallin family protein [Ktedonobacterales bacterium]
MLARWFDTDPFHEMTTLRSAMDRLLEQAVVRPGSFLATGQGVTTPPINVVEHNNRYIVQVYLPGMRADDVELSVRQGTLTIKGRWPEPTFGDQIKEVTWLLQEFGGGEFARTVTLPKQVAGDQVEAQYDHGVLTVVLPLAQHEQPKTISIREGNSKTVLGSANNKESQLTGASSR